MPEPISSSNQSLNYTPADSEPADGGMCVAPEVTSQDSAPEPQVKTTYGDGKIHREGIGIRVDPSVTHTAKAEAHGQDVHLTLTGVDALIAATTRNADGSEGARLAANGNIVQGVVTVPSGSGGEVTLGLGLGVGFDASSGARDADADGEKEYCVRASFGAFVLGACTEAIPSFFKGLVR